MNLISKIIIIITEINAIKASCLFVTTHLKEKISTFATKPTLSETESSKPSLTVYKSINGTKKQKQPTQLLNNGGFPLTKEAKQLFF